MSVPGPHPQIMPSDSRAARSDRAFTLIELLAVLAIIGFLAAVALPQLKSSRKSNVMVDAGLQLVDDIALARRRAISGRTTVHMVFVATNIAGQNAMKVSGLAAADQKLAQRLESGPYTSYALFAERSVGDQPGQPHFRYLSDWRSLPEGVMVSQTEFFDFGNNSVALWGQIPQDRPFEFIDIPFPTENGVPYRLPHIAFDSQGRLKFSTLKKTDFPDEFISLAHGSILSKRLDDGSLYFDVKETLRKTTNDYVRVRIDGATGRARIEHAELP